MNFEFKLIFAFKTKKIKSTMKVSILIIIKIRVVEIV